MHEIQHAAGQTSHQPRPSSTAARACSTAGKYRLQRPSMRATPFACHLEGGMSLCETHLPINLINLPLHGFSFPNKLRSIHNPNLCRCIHLLSIFKRCCNWLLAQHMFPSGNGQQGLLLETWSKLCSILIEWSMDIIGNCNVISASVKRKKSCPCEGV